MHSSPAMLQSVSSLLACTNIPDTDTATVCSVCSLFYLPYVLNTQMDICGLPMCPLLYVYLLLNMLNICALLYVLIIVCITLCALLFILLNMHALLYVPTVVFVAQLLSNTYNGEHTEQCTSIEHIEPQYA